MTLQIIVNLLVAFAWMFFQNTWDFLTFFLGYIIGLVILFGMRRFFSTRFYMKNVIAAVSLLLLFIKELVLSNIAVVKVVLSPKLTMQPGIFALPIQVKKDWEIVLLANLITLTPGTLVLSVSDDNKLLYVHALDIPDVEEAITSIKESFEKAIMEVSR
ncbi:Na+/H+ antiporter subunit E [Bacillus sp. Marseille-P3661]|uniref:Na+/H+ antiporter subunit E n=1 Tax=Bacillus sp. Marseille-P3661 TaxID=1936234 RepID=UPI000C82C21F|nr:Na+/H+ antiporter subunit E [Bacillus sp. Marseille-P3661]